jgi:transcriptional regulator with XRE-family HTH domain
MRYYFQDQSRRLQAIRIACGFDNHTKWIAELRIAKSTWSELESGNKPISLEMARAIKARWHLPLDFILDGDTETLDQAPAKILRKLQELAA